MQKYTICTVLCSKVDSKEFHSAAAIFSFIMKLSVYNVSCKWPHHLYYFIYILDFQWIKAMYNAWIYKYSPIGSNPLCGSCMMVYIVQPSSRSPSFFPALWQILGATKITEWIHHSIMTSSSHASMSIPWQQWHHNLTLHWFRVIWTRFAQIQPLIYIQKHKNK